MFNSACVILFGPFGPLLQALWRFVVPAQVPRLFLGYRRLKSINDPPSSQPHLDGRAPFNLAVLKRPTLLLGQHYEILEFISPIVHSHVVLVQGNVRKPHDVSDFSNILCLATSYSSTLLYLNLYAWTSALRILTGGETTLGFESPKMVGVYMSRRRTR